MRPAMHAPTSSATCRWTAEYDDRGDMTQQAYFDEANRPTYHKDGYALVQFEHDRNGNITKKMFLNPNGKPAWHKEGYTTWKAKYDDARQHHGAGFLR